MKKSLIVGSIFLVILIIGICFKQFIFKSNKNSNFDFKVVEEKVIYDNNITMNKKIVKYDGTNDNYKHIANKINDISSRYWEEVKNSDYSVIENPFVNQYLEFVYKDNEIISFVISVEGQIGETSYYESNGYTLKENGEFYQFDNKAKNYYYEQALNNFKESELFNSNQLVDDWEIQLNKALFEYGNYYVDKNNVNFIIPSWKLGFDSATSKTINIVVPINK